MGVFEDIFVKAKVAVDAIGEKAGQFVDVSKLNIKLAELKNDLKAEFESLGKKVYHAKKNDVQNEAEINSAVSQIDNLSLRIEALQKEIASMKNQVICESCGGKNEVGSAFCAKCGKSLKNAEKASKEAEEDDFSEFDD